MNYEEFKKTIVDELSAYFAAYDMDWEIKVQPTYKVNHVLDTIILYCKQFPVMPNFYIKDLYEIYVEIPNLQIVVDWVFKKIIDAMENQNSLQHVFMEQPFSNDKIICRLVNTKQNEELLKHAPHREFLDLSLIYYFVNESDFTSDNSFCSLITNKNAERAGLSEEHLYKWATVNTKKFFPPIIHGMMECVEDLAEQGFIAVEDKELVVDSLDPDVQMYIIGNEKGVNGAVYILYDEVLSEIAERFGASFYILPSSIDDVIAIPVDMGIVDDLVDMVDDVTMNCTALEKRLSKEVYFYDREMHKLSIATDVRDKSLNHTETV